jgi:hypothetical protein
MQLAIGLCFLSMAFLRSEGRPSFVVRVPNGNRVAGVAALGHLNAAGGGATNDFGEAFEGAGTSWTTQLCQADTDGDGATNGEELGDPCCTWTASTGFDGSATSPAMQSPTHPGVPNSFTATQLASMTCGGEADVSSVASSGAASSTASLSSSASASEQSSSSSGSFDDVVAPDDLPLPRFSPGPKVDETPQTSATSAAEQLKSFVGFVGLSIAVALAM